MAKDAPTKKPAAKPDAAADPYLQELDSSMEDILAEEPTRFDIPADQPPGKGSVKAAQKAPSAKPAAKRPSPTKAAQVTPEVSLKGPAELASAIPVQVRVVIGEKPGTLASLLAMKKGEIVELDRGLDAGVDLMVQDKVIARGELVEVEGRLGVRIIRVLKESP